MSRKAVLPILLLCVTPAGAAELCVPINYCAAATAMHFDRKCIGSRAATLKTGVLFSAPATYRRIAPTTARFCRGVTHASPLLRMTANEHGR
ncbi:MAG TPA: hypothetical protein VG986_06305 [Pseudolabrys sp.]|nr:hypothetical protein [Pseudolabrys sp.]